MKIKRIRGYVASGLAVGIIALGGFNAKAAHELMYATSLSDGNLLSFFSDTPGTILTSFAVTGLQANEVLRGIDWQSGTLYGVGSQSHLYTINPATGAATGVGSVFSPILNGNSFGADVGPAGLQTTSDLGQSLTIALGSGVATPRPNLSYAAGDLFVGQSPFITGTAFNATNWLAADSQKNSFAIFNPATGVLNTIGTGVSGIDFSRENGFDISFSTGIAYLASPAASSDPQANLYTVDKATGTVSLVGLIGAPGANILVGNLTVVPEPSAVAMLAFGGLLLVVFRRRH